VHALALDSSGSSSSSSSSKEGEGKGEGTVASRPSDTALAMLAPFPHAAVLAVCNGLLDAACPAAPQVQAAHELVELQARVVQRVCAYVQQQLLAGRQPWPAVLGPDAPAAGE